MKKYINVDVARRIIDSPRSKEQMLMVLGSAEPADVVEVVHGEWLEKEVVDNTDEDFDWKIEQWQSARCSVCGKYHTTPYVYYFDNFNYCPNCGADMRGENNELHK